MAITIDIPRMQDDIIIAGTAQRVWFDPSGPALTALIPIIKIHTKAVGGGKPNDFKMGLGAAASGNTKSALANNSLTRPKPVSCRSRSKRAVKKPIKERRKRFPESFNWGQGRQLVIQHVAPRTFNIPAMRIEIGKLRHFNAFEFAFLLQNIEQDRRCGPCLGVAM